MRLICTCLLVSVFSMALAQEGTYRQLTPFEIHIHSLCKEIVESGKTVDRLTESDFADLPLGIARQVGGGTYVVAIDSAYSTEQGWFLSAYMSVTFPGSTQPLAFAAKNIGFNAGGLSTTSQVRLLLASPLTFPLSEHVDLELPADGRNFVEFDCNGFRSVNLKGNFFFSEATFRPDEELAKGETRVKATFEVNTGDLNNIMVGVNITPFQIVGLDDLAFEVKNATVDMSDLINPPGLVLSPEYQQTYGQDIWLWRGFYLQEVAVRLRGFSRPPQSPPSLEARNLLIDDLGVSGTFTAANFMALQQGSAGGWPISIDRLSVKLMFSRVAGGSLSGLLQVPFLGENPVAYSAQMEQVADQLNYKFAVATGEDVEFKTPLLATLRISKGSLISIEKINGQLIASTSLHGVLSLGAEGVSVSDIQFQDLRLTTRRPYVEGGVFSTQSSKQPKAAGFPVRIDSIRLRIYQGQIGLGLRVALNFMGADDKGFSAETYVQVLAAVREIPGSSNPAEVTQMEPARQEWKFEKVQFHDIMLEANTTAFTLKGRLTIFRNDPTYGDGFRGLLGMTIGEVLKNPINVTAYFGSTDAFRYWHFDAYVGLGKPIPVAGPIQIIGLTGGASYRMRRSQPFTPDFAVLNKTSDKAPPADTRFAFLPDGNSGLTFMAGVTLIMSTDNVFNADALLEVAFNDRGGIRYVNFRGAGYFFTATKERDRSAGDKATPSSVSAPVFASLNVIFDNEKSIFHANLKTYVNLAGVIRGVGPNGMVGEAVIHVDPRDWYVYIGRPTQMFGIDVARLAVAQTYFMIGTKVENIPPPPDEVREIFKDIDPGLMRNESALASGRGFALGAHFRVGVSSFDSNGRSKIRPFYFIIAVRAGTDVMLRDFGNAYCVGRSGKIGVDGWYASGQAYVFLKGKVGIIVKKKEFDIVSLGAAALLQAKLPNPTWLKGQIGGSYRILGGLVKGKFNIKLTVGEECEVINPGGELDDIKVIADMKPDMDATDVSVFSAPQVSFNTALETEFTMINTQDQVNAYRIRLQELKLRNAGTDVPASIEWNASRDVAVLRTAEVLPPQANLLFTAKVFWEKKNSNGSWEVIKENGQIVYEVKEMKFTTGTAPSFIPDENVAFSYPVKRQYYVHINESGVGYVKLKMGQNYLFADQTNGVSWTYLARFVQPGGSALEVPLQYDAARKQVNFQLPQTLSRQAVYRLVFVKRPPATNAIDQNVIRSNVKVESGEGNETTVASNTLEGSLTQSIEKEIYSSLFRTSQFGTFAERWSSFEAGQDVFDVARGYVAVIGKRGMLSEMLDEAELGLTGQPGLVQVQALPETQWFRDRVSPLLYDTYPLSKEITIGWREPDVLGIRPLKGVSLRNDQGNFKLEDAMVSSGQARARSGSVVLGYFISFYSYWDYEELKNKAAALYLDKWNSAPPAARNLILQSYTDLLKDNYPVEVTYTLPGAIQPTYRGKVSIRF
ncbi:MAG: hypothetical protein ACK5U1_07305 [Cyclobacteriaceae bacterium]